MDKAALWSNDREAQIAEFAKLPLLTYSEGQSAHGRNGSAASARSACLSRGPHCGKFRGDQLKSSDRSYKHRKLFDAGVKALQGYGVEGEIYRCPICQRDYDERAIKKNSPVDYSLTLEHAPPDSIGGKIVALTCKSCNNELGSWLDSQIAAREQLFRFIDPNRPDPRPFAGKITLSESPEISTNIQISGKVGSGISIKAGGNNKPSNLSETKNKIENAHLSGGAFHASLSLPMYNESRADLAFLKSAFLCLFGKFGYTYALSYPGRYISRKFLEKDNVEVVKIKPVSGYERSILVSQNAGVCFVGFGEFSVVCPWINADVEKYAAVCNTPELFLGNYKGICPFDMPFELEAILDFGSSKHT